MLKRTRRCIHQTIAIKNTIIAAYIRNSLFPCTSAIALHTHM
jgi:hypothetical protein